MQQFHHQIIHQLKRVTCSTREWSPQASCFMDKIPMKSALLGNNWRSPFRAWNPVIIFLRPYLDPSEHVVFFPVSGHSHRKYGENVDYQRIGLRENLNRKPWIFPWKIWGFPVSIFPSTDPLRLMDLSPYGGFRINGGYPHSWMVSSGK